MEALVLNEDYSLAVKQVALPSIKPNEVLVKVKAAALNHREIWITKGMYPGMNLPCILGADGAGEVVKVGIEVDPYWDQQNVIIYPGYDWGNYDEAPLKSFRVLGMPDPGTLAQYIAVPRENLVIKPAFLSWEEAAALPVAYLTAWRALTRHGRISKGSKILITGIGGGVAQAGMSFAKAFGAEIFVTSGNEEKLASALISGAKFGINYKDEEWPMKLKHQSHGIDLVLDGSPLNDLNMYLRFLNMGGKIIAYGATATRTTSLNISKFFLRHIQFIGTAMGSPREFQAMIDFIEKHKIKPKIHKTFRFQQCIEAISHLDSGNHTGKIVLLMR